MIDKSYFDKVIDRRNTFSYKWDVKDNEIPLFVADMDFKVAPCITEDMQKRIEHGVFGYNIIPKEWYESIILWWRNHHDLEIKENELLYSAGVIASIASCIRAFSKENDYIAIMSPVYHVFFNVIRNNNRKVLEIPLLYTNAQSSDKTAGADVYSIDFELFEKEIRKHRPPIFILCNPQNPTGNLWKKSELTKILEIVRKYDILLISDEIHCDIIQNKSKYMPFLSICTPEDKTIMCASATKAFNLAGIMGSFVVVKNRNLFSLLKAELNNSEVLEPNIFAIVSTISAFNKGKEWLDALNDYIYDNKIFVYEYLRANIPQIKFNLQDSLYLLWLDCSYFSQNSSKLALDLRKNAGLYFSCGAQFGANGNEFLRMNIATPKIRLEESLLRLKNFVKTLG